MRLVPSRYFLSDLQGEKEGFQTLTPSIQMAPNVTLD